MKYSESENKITILINNNFISFCNYALLIFLVALGVLFLVVKFWLVLFPLISIFACARELYSTPKKVVFDMYEKSATIFFYFHTKKMDYGSIFKFSKVEIANYYQINLNEDKYGQGFRITPKSRFILFKNQKDCLIFENEILPKIKFLESNTIIDGVTKSQYKKQNDSFYAYDINSALIIISFVILFLSIRVFITGYEFIFNSTNDFLKSLAPVWILLSFIIFGNGVKRTRILPKTFELYIEFLFGFYKKKYQIKTPIKLQTVTNNKSSIRVDTDVYLLTTSDNIKIKNFTKSKQIESFVLETENLFK